MDDLLESITFGLELNDFKLNQRRVAEIRYLGELYSYKVIESSIIFDTLFKLLSYGHGRSAELFHMVIVECDVCYRQLAGARRLLRSRSA